VFLNKGKVHVKSFWPKKLRTTEEKKKTLFLSCFSFDFFITFLAVSLHEEPKNTTKTFSKTRPKNLKQNKRSQEKAGR
jgi:hypothetical protein